MVLLHISVVTTQLPFVYCDRLLTKEAQMRSSGSGQCTNMGKVSPMTTAKLGIGFGWLPNKETQWRKPSLVLPTARGEA